MLQQAFESRFVTVSLCSARRFHVALSGSGDFFFHWGKCLRHSYFQLTFIRGRFTLIWSKCLTSRYMVLKAFIVIFFFESWNLFVSYSSVSQIWRCKIRSYGHNFFLPCYCPFDILKKSFPPTCFWTLNKLDVSLGLVVILHISLQSTTPQCYIQAMSTFSTGERDFQGSCRLKTIYLDWKKPNSAQFITLRNFSQTAKIHSNRFN